MVTILIGFAVRFAQVGIEASLTLVVGVFTAAIFRRMVGPAGTRRLFGSGVRGLMTGWLAGMLLPVCSLGVIPVARELRRAGVPGGTVLAFVLAAPLLNPISFLYGLTLAKPIVILAFAGCSLVLSTLAGWLWDRVFARHTDAAESKRLADLADSEPLPTPGLRRLLAVLVSAVKELTGRDLLF
ncbi:MAG: permease, partial [Fimbriiglobus sp.]|nr:permease [Fimbriiglobus sp.]